MMNDICTCARNMASDAAVGACPVHGTNRLTKAYPSPYPAGEKLEAVEREIKYRIRVYERRVREHQMTQAAADYQLAIFRAIADDYRALVESERFL